MNRNIFSIIVFLFVVTDLYAQEERIVKFIFESGARGSYREYIAVRQDSTFISERGRRDYSAEFSGATTDQEWIELLKTISEYALHELINSPSPTNYRTFDGASISQIAIVTDKREYNCGQFDNYNPNEKLKNLMQSLLKVKNNKL